MLPSCLCLDFLCNCVWISLIYLYLCFSLLLSFLCLDFLSNFVWISLILSICICASNCLPLVCAWISYQTLFGLISLILYIVFFIRPESDHWLCLSLTHCCLVNLIDVTWRVKMPTQNLLMLLLLLMLMMRNILTTVLCSFGS